MHDLEKNTKLDIYEVPQLTPYRGRTRCCTSCHVCPHHRWPRDAAAQQLRNSARSQFPVLRRSRVSTPYRPSRSTFVSSHLTEYCAQAAREPNQTLLSPFSPESNSNSCIPFSEGPCSALSPDDPISLIALGFPSSSHSRSSAWPSYDGSMFCILEYAGAGVIGPVACRSWLPACNSVGPSSELANTAIALSTGSGFSSSSEPRLLVLRLQKLCRLHQQSTTTANKTFAAPTAMPNMAPVLNLDLTSSSLSSSESLCRMVSRGRGSMLVGGWFSMDQFLRPDGRQEADTIQRDTGGMNGQDRI